ncbi:hypothetical protein BOTBODRAFT_38315 [Botryobasidium botryosum FD-172 SS1]|uniref:Uncharacterized protein n=1 Tax=Botryobasidium botryosum (strain FD-172 SS1) TaxID=930990 RepID=A0A067LXP1_BOTB1|nr:hypothetical protein BOTBODRAFT_38315 [Botryobasidium botryosum FD-172 SS1]
MRSKDQSTTRQKPVVTMQASPPFPSPPPPCSPPSRAYRPIVLDATSADAPPRKEP